MRLVRSVVTLGMCSVFFSALSATASAEDSQVINACVNSSGANKGQVRIVASTETCAKNETPIHWNVSGPAGPPGPSGTGGGGGGTPTDTDNDGIPDVIDPCPNAPNFAYNGGSYCPATIYNVTLGQLATGATVWLSNLSVTIVTGSMVTISIDPTDPNYAGPDGASLTINAQGLPLPSVGNHVNVIGMVTSGHGLAPAAIIIVF